MCWTLAAHCVAQDTGSQRHSQPAGDRQQNGRTEGSRVLQEDVYLISPEQVTSHNVRITVSCIHEATLTGTGRPIPYLEMPSERSPRVKILMVPGWRDYIHTQMCFQKPFHWFSYFLISLPIRSALLLRTSGAWWLWNWIHSTWLAIYGVREGKGYRQLPCFWFGWLGRWYCQSRW